MDGTDNKKDFVSTTVHRISRGTVAKKQHQNNLPMST